MNQMSKPKSKIHPTAARMYEVVREKYDETRPGFVAKLMNVSPQTVNNWEERGVSKEGMILFQDITGCMVSWLATGTGQKYDNRNTERAPTLSHGVPVLTWIQAGKFSEVISNPPEDAERIPCPCKLSDMAYALRVRGISMEPKYSDGDVIFVDPAREARHGSNVIVRMENDNEAVFKQLVVEGEHKFLRPLNPEWPGPKLIEINGNATICGVVVGKWVMG